jgi:hypothetical protein
MTYRYMKKFYALFDPFHFATFTLFPQFVKDKITIDMSYQFVAEIGLLILPRVKDPGWPPSS